jgi:hypothetical protein
MFQLQIERPTSLDITDEPRTPSASCPSSACQCLALFRQDFQYCSEYSYGFILRQAVAKNAPLQKGRTDGVGLALAGRIHWCYVSQLTPITNQHSFLHVL